MPKCQLNFNISSYTPGSAGNCGFDFWHSPLALKWIEEYLHAKPAQITITATHSETSLFCWIRHLAGGLFLASAYPYGCIKGDINLFWRAEKELAQTLRKHRIVRLEIAFTGKWIHQLNTIQNHSRIKISPKLEAVRHVLDLTAANNDPQSLEKEFGSKIRWAMRKAERSGATIQVAQSHESTIIQEIYAQTMRRKGAPVNYGEERFKGIINKFTPLNQGKIYIGYIHNEPAGFAALVQGTKSCHLIQLAVLPKKQATRLSELLIGTALQEAAASNIQYFDFMASSKTDTGLIAFKAKWKGVPEIIHHAIIPSIPVMHHIVGFARGLNKLKGKLIGHQKTFRR